MDLEGKSGTLCAIGAVIGVFATAYFSGKAAVEAKETIPDDPDMDIKEKGKHYIRCYWKTALSMLITSGLIIGSDRIHVKEIAVAGAGAAMMWKDRYDTLDKKIKDTLGEDKVKEIKKEISEEACETYIPRESTGSTAGTKVLVYEPYTDQYIETTNEAIWVAMYKANEQLQKTFDVRLNYIIRLLGGKPTSDGEKIGWNWENEVQDYAWSYYGGPWIEPCPCVRPHGNKEAVALFYMVDPETQTAEDMIYREA